MSQNFEVGVGKVDITPEKGLLMAGDLYPRTYDTIKDPLFVKSIVIAMEGMKIAIITLDLAYFMRKNVMEVKENIKKATGILPQNVVICPSHTHSGPYIDVDYSKAKYLEEKDSYLEKEKLHLKYRNKVYDAITQATIQANADLQPCIIGLSKGEVKGISHNRRVLKENGDCWNTWLLPKEEWSKWPAAGPVDTDLYVLAAITKYDKIKALLFNYAVHACTNSDARSISADFPAYVEQEIQNRLGSNLMTLFVPGACGNINGNYSSEVIGKKIGEEIIKTLEVMDFNVKPVLSAKSIEIELPVREITHFQGEEIFRKWPRAVEYYVDEYDKLIKQKQSSLKSSLTGIRIGDNAFIFNPAELFVEFGMEIKENSPFKHTVVVELTNDCVGYVPTKIAFKQGGYETFHATQSKLAPEAGDIIVKESLNILNELFD